MLVGLNGNKVSEPITLIFVGVPAKVTVQLIGACTTSNNVATVSSMDEVIAFIIIDFIVTMNRYYIVIMVRGSMQVIVTTKTMNSFTAASVP